MHPTALDQLNRRIVEQHAHVSEQLQALHAELRELRNTLERAENGLLHRFEAHADYHRQNEHHWGPERLAQRYPLRTALLATIITTLLLGLAPSLPHMLENLVTLLAHIY